MTVDSESMRKVLTERKAFKCPCCDRLVKVYRRKLNSEMARTFLQLYKAYVKFPRYYSTRELKPHDNKAASDIIYLVHWELIEKSDGVNSSLAPAGMYRPTEKGLRFAHRLERVPSHVHLLNNKVVGWSQDTIDIKEALGSKFNYAELMN